MHAQCQPFTKHCRTLTLPHVADKDKLTGRYWKVLAYTLASFYLLSLDFLFTKLLGGVKFLAFFIAHSKVPIIHRRFSPTCAVA